MEEILKILENIHPEHDFKASQDFVADGLLDSFDIVTLVTEIEQKFGVIIDGEDVTPENFRNVASLNQLLRRYRPNHEPEVSQ